MFHRILHCDVLVAGGGGAGIRCAATAAGHGLRVTLLSDAEPGSAGSTFYPLTFEWGMLSASDPEDARQFGDEILQAAGQCIDPALARMLAERSQACLSRLRKEGLPFTTMAELGITGCFGREPRGVFLKDMGAFIDAQRALLRSHPNLTVMTGLTAVSLAVADGRCCGLVAVDEQGGAVLLLAKAVVLALGGGEDLYEQRAAAGNLLGSAYAMAARQGVRLVNLEFIQFVPGTVTPVRGMNYYPFGLCEEPKVLNGLGEPCLKNYLPEGMTEKECLDEHAHHGPFTRETAGKYLEYAMLGEYEAGRGMGLTIVPDAARMNKKRYALWRDFLGRMGFSAGMPMAVYPTAQGFNGGILLRRDLSTDLPGLFACGESSGGLHGPDRMGGLCILATQVFGELAGDAAAAFTRARSDESPDAARLYDAFVGAFSGGRGGDLSPGDVLAAIRAQMQAHAFLRRSESGLNAALLALEDIACSPLAQLGRPGAARAFLADNAALAARLILTAMRNRTESRGSHDRRDFPERDPNQTRMNWVTMNAGRIDAGTMENMFHIT